RMKNRKIGNDEVGEIGLGCMGMSWAYGTPDDDQSLSVLRRSLELGVNHWDTADLYGAGQNELLLAKALKNVRDQVFLATKFGNVTDRSLTSHQDLVRQNEPLIVDGTPEYVRKCCERSLERLGIETIDLYYQHRVDPRVAIEETVGAMAELVKQGKVRYLGLSEAAADTLRRANKVHPIAALQTEYSLWTRDVEDEILPTVNELGMAFVPYSPLGRGFLTGEIKSLDDLSADDWRRTNPRFQGSNLEDNLLIVEKVKEVAKRKGVAVGQVALAWMLTRGENVLPIPGTKRLKYLEENAGASEVTLNQQEMNELSSFKASGARYSELAMQFING
ncbi:MAG TPA: aldo/keto reductase, partial [Fimbriimonas sp.]|nr:aldo/keto reductase [Fimbriimonas sp.]